MKEFTFHVPVTGTILTKVVAKDAEEALNIFFDRQDDILYHPSGVLTPNIEDMLIYDNNVKENKN